MIETRPFRAWNSGQILGRAASRLKRPSGATARIARAPTGTSGGYTEMPVSDRATLGGLTQFAVFAFLRFRKWWILKGRDVRVVEGARLESVCRGNSTVGSNPTLSASP